jgi:hypothetical protein
MGESEEFDKWFDDAGWKTGYRANDLRPIWNNIKTWQDHIVDANKKVSTRKAYGYGIVDKDGKTQDLADNCKEYMEELVEHLNGAEDIDGPGTPPHRIVPLFYED